MMFESIFLIKLFIAVGVVIGLSLLAERVSPKVAGILAGYPTGSAISLFFFGLEVSPEFAAESAIYNMIGLTGSLGFIFFYYNASKRFNILFTSIISILGYLVVSWGLHFIEINKFIAIFIPVIFGIVFTYLFKHIRNTDIKKKKKLNFKTLLIRAVFAASIILVITSIPKLVGAKWAGLLSAFPTTLFPLILIVHYTYSKKHAHAIIKNAPIGIFSLIVYSLTISIVYPIYGIYYGTVISYVVATIYLLIYIKLKNWFKNTTH